MTMEELDKLCINTLRFLAVDAVEQAHSGHPGLPLGAAPMAYVLWSRFLRHDPRDPHWWDRDRFVLSAGHGSALLYALLHLFGYDLPIDELRHFRQWGSRTPGHPESHLTPGVEASTGPLGQGISNAVGMAIGEAHLAARYNRNGHELFRHHTFVLASDGDVMEGVGAEAASLAGHLRLGRLIVLYDNNSVTLSGTTSITFTEDVAAPVRGVRVARRSRDRRQRPARDRARAARRDQRGGAPVADRRRHGARLRRPQQERNVRRARLAAGAGGDRAHEAEPRLAGPAAVPGSSRGEGARRRLADAGARGGGRVAAAVRGIPARVPRTGGRDRAPVLGTAARSLGERPAGVRARREGDGDAQGVGGRAAGAGARAAGAGGRLGRSRIRRRSAG